MRSIINRNSKGFNQPSIRAIVFIFLCAGLLLTAWSCKKVTTQQPEEESVSELTDTQKAAIADLNGLIHPVIGSLYTLDESDLSPLDYLKDIKIVGLGEATHGTQDFFRMKHRIFKYLVEHHGFRAFAFESDYGESIYLDRYVTTGQGDIEALMDEKMIFWTWKTEAVKWLLEWMWEYNKDKPRDRMIRYLGVDCQSFRHQGRLLIEYLEANAPLFLAKVRQLLDYTILLSSSTETQKMSDEEWAQLESDLQGLHDDLAAKESELAAVSGQKEFELAKQLVRNLMQTRTTRYGYARDLKINYRDTFMAENTLWVADFMGPDSKVALWAHNAHIANNPNYGWTGSMGMHLKDRLGHDYQIVGFSFAVGNFNAFLERADGSYGGLQTFYVTSDPVSDSINQIFYHAQHPDFIFRLRDMVPDSSLQNWISADRKVINIGGAFNSNINDYYQTLPLMDFYDVFIHFNDTRESVYINN